MSARQTGEVRCPDCTESLAERCYKDGGVLLGQVRCLDGLVGDFMGFSIVFDQKSLPEMPFT